MASQPYRPAHPATRAVSTSRARSRGGLSSPGTEWSCHRVSRTPRDCQGRRSPPPSGGPQPSRKPRPAPYRNDPRRPVHRRLRGVRVLGHRAVRASPSSGPGSSRDPLAARTQLPSSAAVVLTSTPPDELAAGVAQQLFRSAPVVVVSTEDPAAVTAATGDARRAAAPLLLTAPFPAGTPAGTAAGGAPASARPPAQQSPAGRPPARSRPPPTPAAAPYPAAPALAPAARRRRPELPWPHRRRRRA